MASFPQGFKVALLASDKGIRNAASSVLAACSYKVTPAASVDDCLQLCTVQRIDIVLAESSDLTLNKEKTVQLMASLHSVPLIVMSDTDTPGTVFHGLKIGAVDFLKRPLDEAKVRSMWQHTLQKRITAVPATGDEGSSHAQRRIQPSLPPDTLGTGAGTSRGGTGPALSEGSSNEQKTAMQSTMESSSLPPNDPPPETAQNFTSELQNENPTSDVPSDTASASNAMGPSTQVHGGPRKRAPKTSTETQRRKRPTGSSGSSSHPPPPPNSGARGMSVPPLLGIPPGCIPPVGSNGLAIGMPFLNQHPFVPSTPMNPINTFGFTSPFVYNQGADPDLMSGGISSDIDPTAFIPVPIPPVPSSTSAVDPLLPGNISNTGPATVPTPGTNIELQRVSSTPVTATQDDSTVFAATSPQEETDASQRPLRKSPSLVNF